MLKPAAILAASGTLGGVSLYYSGGGDPTGQAPDLGAYLVEVGVVFPEAAIRAALPEGVEPTPGFTGGIAVHGDKAPWAASSGHVWLDVQTEDGPARYLLVASASQDNKDGSKLTQGALGFHGTSEGDILHVMTWPDAVSSLELFVRAEPVACSHGREADTDVRTVSFTGAPAAREAPSITGWCRMEAEAAVARVTAPPGHPLRPFIPSQVLWAEIMIPPGPGMAALAAR